VTLPFSVPLKCYIMQGENPLPDSVIEKYAKTSGELCKDVFLLSELCLHTFLWYEIDRVDR
jgi:hypothetical protein